MCKLFQILKNLFFVLLVVLYINRIREHCVGQMLHHLLSNIYTYIV